MRVVSEVLAKVTTRTLDVPRGPDVVHRIRVPRAWLEAGDIVELELPRNLACAACEGGGCDVCERAGALTLRGRHEPPEILTVTLPTRKADEELRGVVIRIPEQGGLPPEQALALPRGLLLLRVDCAEVPDPGLSRVRPPSAMRFSERVLSLRIPKPAQRKLWVIALALVVLASLAALLAFRRHPS